MNTRKSALQEVKEAARAVTLKRLEEDNFVPEYPNGYRKDIAGDAPQEPQPKKATKKQKGAE